MKNITNECSKLFKKIKENANICIYGSNEIAKNIYEELKIQRPDVNVKFFVDSTKEFSLDGLPVYLKARNYICHTQFQDRKQPHNPYQ